MHPIAFKEGINENLLEWKNQNLSFMFHRAMIQKHTVRATVQMVEMVNGLQATLTYHKMVYQSGGPRV